jgi:uncharacterized membrane protein YsdA (DUF1294 family)
MMLWAIIGGYALVSIATFVAYGIDKRRAVQGGWRIRERTLHLLELGGGWPGAMVGRAVFRHKGRKLSYGIVLASIILLHAALWGGWWYLHR